MLLFRDEEILARGIDKENVELYRRKVYQAAFGLSTWSSRFILISSLPLAFNFFHFFF
jgi:hypothetical protein